MGLGGSHRKLLCLHGFTGRGAVWDEVAAKIPRGVVAVCPDLLGHGPEPDCSAASFDAEVDRLAAGLPTGEGHGLVGYSLGARLGLALLVRHPQAFAGAVLIGARPGLASAEARRARRAADGVLVGLLRDAGVEAFLRRWEAQPLFATQRGLPAARLEAQRRLRRSHTASGLARALEVLGLGAMPSYRRRLTAVRQPVRLMVGERDDRFRSAAGELAASLRRSELEVVPGAGHNLVLESPENVAMAICEGLERW